MISEAAAGSGCYVYITLPGQTRPVTAGRFELRAEGPPGAAAGQFVYGRSYRSRADAVEFDPVELRLAERVYETARMGGLFGALRDAAPDSWGRRVMERRAGKARLSEFEYLLNAPDDRAGALGFGLEQEPPAAARTSNTVMDLEKFQTLADAVIQQDSAGLPLSGAFITAGFGTSMGGARPKAVLEDAGALWLAKFNRPDDRWNFARVEHAMLLLARECGVNAAESRIVSLGGRDALLVKRFDRAPAENGGWLKARMVSGLTLLQADETSGPEWSYVLLAEELRRVCAAPKAQAQELFRRMCFNALIANTDDHPRNHAVIAPEREWALSPAYDLTPAPPAGGSERRYLAMACGAQGRIAARENLLSECGRFMLKRPEAEAAASNMENQVQNGWRAAAQKAGVSPKDRQAIEGAFAPPGFGRGAGLQSAP